MEDLRKRLGAAYNALSEQMGQVLLIDWNLRKSNGFEYGLTTKRARKNAMASLDALLVEMAGLLYDMNLTEVD